MEIKFLHDWGDITHYLYDGYVLGNINLTERESFHVWIDNKVYSESGRVLADSAMDLILEYGDTPWAQDGWFIKYKDRYRTIPEVREAIDAMHRYALVFIPYDDDYKNYESVFKNNLHGPDMNEYFEEVNDND